MSPERYRIVLVAPPANPYAEGLREVAESLALGLRGSGRTAELVTNDVDRDAVNIVLNPQLLGDDAARALPAGTILCNFEQVHGDSPWMKARYVDLVRRHVTWDYSARNLDAWRTWVPDARVVHVPLGYVPEHTRIRSRTEDIDVLFYGTRNARRERVLKALEAGGVRVVDAFGQFGSTRDALIGRAKLVLNVHYYESRIFEMPRVAYLLANRKAVVCEVDPDTDIEDDIRDAVAGVPYERLVERCVELLRDDAGRRALADRGFEAFRRRSQARILDEALRASPAEARTASAALPRRLNAGCGKRWRIDCLNVDVDPQWRPDLVADLGSPLPLAESVDLGRFGRRLLPRDHFDEIVANRVLASVRDLAVAMTSFVALLREGGTLHAEIPFASDPADARDAAQSRTMNARGLRELVDGFRPLDGSEFRFERVELRYLLSDRGRELSAGGMPADEVVRQPHAVDAMRVALRKVGSTDVARVGTGAR